MLVFEVDEYKSRKNVQKHGIDFCEAQRLWDDDYYLEIPARNVDEKRYMIIGIIEGKYWSAIITYRNASTRIISVRRSRKEEVELYESF